MALLDAKQIKNLAQKLPVRAITTAALAAGGPGVYANGTAAGFGATLTATSNSALDVIDGVTLVVGDRVLIKNEVAPANNGIYTVTVIGSGAAKWVLTRASDCDTNIKTFPGIAVKGTADGATNGSKDFILTTITNPIIIGTTSQTWATESESSAPTPSANNKGMTASVTTADFQVATATTLTTTPANGSYIQVFVNGAKQNLGNAVRTKDCYFSVDGGATARAFSAIVAGDTLYWVASVSSWNLAATDLIDFDYSV